MSVFKHGRVNLETKVDGTFILVIEKDTQVVTVGLEKDHAESIVSVFDQAGVELPADPKTK